MDAKQETKARESKKTILGKRLQTEPLHLLALEYPELIFGYAKLEGDIKAFKRASREDKPDCKDLIPNTWNIEIPLLDQKKKHYWIYSHEGDYGKTKFHQKLADLHRVTYFE